MIGTLLTLLYVFLIFVPPWYVYLPLAPYRIQLIVAVLAVLGSVPGLMGGAAGRVSKLQWALMAGFTLIVIFSWLPHLWFGGCLMAMTEFLPAGIVFFLVGINFQSLPRLRVLRFLLVAVTLWQLAQGVWGYYFTRGDFLTGGSVFIMSQHVGEGETELRRLQGLGNHFLGDPNTWAQYLMALIPLLYVSRRRRMGASRVLAVLITAFLLYGIFLTRSRGALVGLAVMGGLMVQQRFKTRLAPVLLSGLLLAALVGMNFAGGRDVSLEAGGDRLALWSDGLGMFRSSPLWGRGFNEFTDLSRLTAHNSFLLCAAEEGLLGYFFWVGLLVVTVWKLREAELASALKIPEPAPGWVVSDPPQIEIRRWARAMRLSLYAFLLTSFFLSRTYAPHLYLLLGMASAVAAIDAGERGAEAAGAPRHWVQWTLGICFGSLALIYVLVRLHWV